MRAEEGETGQRGRRDRGGGIDLVHHPERDLLQSRAALAGVGESGPQRDGGPESHPGLAQVGALRLRVAQQPPDALGLLRATGVLGRHRADLLELVVHDRGRHDRHVGLVELPHRVDDVGEQSQFGLPELAGPAATALDVPLQVEALLDDVGEVGAHRELVDRVRAELASDEDHAGAAGHRAHRPEREIVPAEHEVGWEVVVAQHFRQDQRIDIGPVGGQEDQAGGPVEGAQGVEVLDVDGDVPGPLVQSVEGRREHVVHEPALGGDEGREFVGGLGDHRIGGPTQFGCEFGRGRLESRRTADLLGDQPGDLVAITDDLAFGSLGRHRRLEQDELGERRTLRLVMGIPGA